MRTLIIADCRNTEKERTVPTGTTVFNSKYPSWNTQGFVRASSAHFE